MAALWFRAAIQLGCIQLHPRSHHVELHCHLSHRLKDLMIDKIMFLISINRKYHKKYLEAVRVYQVINIFKLINRKTI